MKVGILFIAGLWALLMATFAVMFWMSDANAEIADPPEKVTTTAPAPAAPKKFNPFDVSFEACLDTTCNSGHGSAFYVGGDYFLTAGHVGEAVGKAGTLYLKRKDGRVILTDLVWIAKNSDWSLLKARNAVTGIDAPKLACKPPPLDSAIYTIGNPQIFLFVKSNGQIAGDQDDVVGFWKKVILTNMAVSQGNSGGPVFGADDSIWGNLVGGLPENQNLSIVEPLSKICSLLPKGVVAD